MSESPLVRLEVHDRVAILTLDHPPANTLSLATLDALSEALAAALADDAVKAIVLTGAGKLFAAGADIKELNALSRREDAVAFSAKGQALCRAIEDAPKPVIAALNGRYAVGGGAEIAMACHLRLAEESTQIGSPEVHLGLMVGWGASQRLPRLVGVGRAIEMLLGGQPLAAAQAERIGLVNRVVPDGEGLAEAQSLARQLTALSGPVLAATLDAVRTGVREGFEAGMARERAAFGALCEHADWHEGTQAFLEKRPPQFRDE